MSTRSLRRPMRLGASGLIAAAACAGALAFSEGTTPQGYRYASGGVSDGERVTLRADRERFSLWVVTAAKGSGAYLSDVRVKVVDSGGQPVYEGALDGPWLLLELPTGRYQVEASLNGETQRKATTIHPGDHHQAVFYFNVDANLSPELAQPAARLPD